MSSAIETLQRYKETSKDSSFCVLELASAFKTVGASVDIMGNNSKKPYERTLHMRVRLDGHVFNIHHSSTEMFRVQGPQGLKMHNFLNKVIGGAPA